MAKIKGESELTFMEAASIIVGHGVGAGILSVPYLAAHNSFRETVLILLIGYAVALVLHFLIAELSLNNDGAQFVKCFDAELFSGQDQKDFHLDGVYTAWRFCHRERQRIPDRRRGRVQKLVRPARYRRHADILYSRRRRSVRRHEACRHMRKDRRVFNDGRCRYSACWQRCCATLLPSPQDGRALTTRLLCSAWCHFRCRPL